MHFLPVRSIACNNKSIFSRFHDKVIIGFRLWCRIDVQRMCFPQPRIAHIPGHPGNDIVRSCFRTPEVINASAIPIRMQMGRQNQIHMACIKDRHKFLSFRRKSFFSPFLQRHIAEDPCASKQLSTFYRSLLNHQLPISFLFQTNQDTILLIH